MTPEEAIKILEKKKEYSDRITDNFLDYSSVEIKDANETIEMCDMAISALKEIQQYREIGTVEECREAREKQNSKNSKITHKSGAIYCNCPSCGLNLMKIENNIQFGHIPMYCEYCGQAIKWDTENLEGMEDE